MINAVKYVNAFINLPTFQIFTNFYPKFTAVNHKRITVYIYID